METLALCERHLQNVHINKKIFKVLFLTLRGFCCSKIQLAAVKKNILRLLSQRATRVL